MSSEALHEAAEKLSPATIDRVYVVEKAIAGLGYRPVHDFASLFRRPAP